MPDRDGSGPHRVTAPVDDTLDDRPRSPSDGPLRALVRIRRAPPLSPSAPAGEQCELCTVPITDEHDHLVDVESRSLMCSCRGCYLLFTPNGAGGNRFRAVPDRYVSFDDFTLSPAQWDSLQIPVSVAFFFRNSSLDRVAAFYPSPAGATESLLDLEAWDEVVAANPVLASMVPDVEALLIRTSRGGGPECHLVPIDICYELVGLIRNAWKGFDGGQDAGDQLDDFFARVHARSEPAGAVAT